jgi:hypothetical protein
MAEGFTFDVEDFNTSIDALIKRVDFATREAVAKGGHVIERLAKSNFEGNHSPGEPHVGGRKPNTVSGSLRRSITLIPKVPVSQGPGKWMVAVAPTMIYGRRIELGFHGTDSIGRFYGPPANPAPYPYFEPAFDAALPILPRIFTDSWAKALGA